MREKQIIMVSSADFSSNLDASWKLKLYYLRKLCRSIFLAVTRDLGKKHTLCCLSLLAYSLSKGRKWWMEEIDIRGLCSQFQQNKGVFKALFFFYKWSMYCTYTLNKCFQKNSCQLTVLQIMYCRTKEKSMLNSQSSFFMNKIKSGQ